MHFLTRDITCKVHESLVTKRTPIHACRAGIAWFKNFQNSPQGPKTAYLDFSFSFQRF